MADVNRGNRPLSPFMLGTYYRLQITSVSSLVTRITGNALLLAALLIVWWFLAAATSPDYFAVADAVLTSWFGDLVMTLSVWALWYHSLAGLRHLVWDQGHFLDIATAEKLGYGLFIGATVLTVLTLIAV